MSRYGAGVDPAADILDAVAFLRAQLNQDLQAVENLLEHADPKAILLAMSSLFVTQIPNLPEVLDSWHQLAIDALADGQ